MGGGLTVGGPMRAPTLFCSWCQAGIPSLLVPMGFTFSPFVGVPADDRDRYWGCLTLPQWRYKCNRCGHQEIHVSKWWAPA